MMTVSHASCFTMEYGVWTTKAYIKIKNKKQKVSSRVGTYWESPSKQKATRSWRAGR